MTRSPFLLLVVLLVPIVLSGCGSPGYSAKLEEDYNLQPTGPWPKHTQVFAFGNTGKPVQNVVTTVDTHGTYAIRRALTYLQLDSSIVSIDYSKGGVYTPAHWMTAEPLSHTGSRWDWYLGDLPHGYRIVAGLVTRRIKPLGRRGYLLEAHWHAVSAPGQPRRTWKHLTGVSTSMG